MLERAFPFLNNFEVDDNGNGMCNVDILAMSHRISVCHVRFLFSLKKREWRKRKVAFS
jgi:hypothetical protein